MEGTLWEELVSDIVRGVPGMRAHKVQMHQLCVIIIIVCIIISFSATVADFGSAIY